MTQAEFNAMLQVALSQGLSGYYTSKYTGEEIDHRLDNAAAPVINENFLDNWYFANPVNQRGQTVYNSAGGGYCIDRWFRGFTAEAELSLQDGYVRFVGSDNAEFLQRTKDLHLGEELTASVFLQDGTLVWATATMPATYSGGYLNTDIYCAIPNTGGAALNLSYYDNLLRFDLICPSGAILKPVAAKLEAGPEQTLCKKDANGNWVLLQKPRFSDMLSACLMYFRTYDVLWATSGGSQTQFLTCDLHYKMQSIPTVSVSSIYNSEGTEASGVELINAQRTDNSMYVAQLSAIQPANTWLQLRGVSLSAEL